MVIRAGMSRKIDEALRQQVDGEPATKGAPIASEARYYYNFYLAHSEVSFDAYLQALSRELAKAHPDITVTHDWMLACDRRGHIASARRELTMLRASVEHGRQFHSCFWSMLWKIRDVYVKELGLSYAELGASHLEINELAWRYLLAECRIRVEKLDSLTCQTTKHEAQQLFCIVDDMMNGVAMPLKRFSETWDARYASSGAYKAYCETTEGRAISTEMAGWSELERRRFENALFPNGRPKRSKPTMRERDPTAPALADTRIATNVPSKQTAFEPAAECSRKSHLMTWHDLLATLIARAFACPQPALVPC